MHCLLNTVTLLGDDDDDDVQRYSIKNVMLEWIIIWVMHTCHCISLNSLTTQVCLSLPTINFKIVCLVGLFTLAWWHRFWMADGVASASLNKSLSHYILFVFFFWWSHYVLKKKKNNIKYNVKQRSHSLDNWMSFHCI